MQWMMNDTEIEKQGQKRVKSESQISGGFWRACISNNLEIMKAIVKKEERKAAINRKEIIHQMEKWIREGSWKLVEWMMVECAMKKTPRMQELLEKNPRARDCWRAKEEKECLSEVFKEGKRKKSGKCIEAGQDKEGAYMKEKEGEGERRGRKKKFKE